MRTRVVVARPMPDLVTDRLSDEFDAVPAERPDLDVPTLIERTRTHDAEALVITSDVRFGPEQITALPRSMKIVATCSVGFDHLDVPVAKERGLVLTNTPDVVTKCTCRRDLSSHRWRMPPCV
jgi:lactate dehydrogenase-like 2-hydroxyacid dehydrogenase